VKIRQNSLTMTATLNHCWQVAKKSFGKFMLHVFLIYVTIAAGEFSAYLIPGSST